MSIFGAMSTAVAGLQAQSFALENVSGNIANSQTTGFKRVNTSFADLVFDQPARHEMAGSVTSFSQLTNTIQGGLQTTGISTNMALNGEGYFVVARSEGTNNGQPVFGAIDLYTRRGDFALDRGGYLVNGAGYTLQGFAIDSTTGRPSSSDPRPIQLSDQPLAASATTRVTYRGNLPSVPATANADPAVASSELLAPPGTGTPAFPAGYDPRVLASPAAAGSGFVAGQDQTRFVNQSISGGSVTAYDSAGNAIDVQLRWAKVANADPTATPPVQDTWNLFYLRDGAATGNAAAWQNAGVPITFDASGRMTAPSGGSVAIPNLIVGTASLGAVTVDLGTGLTQYASSNGLMSTPNIQQDGYASGSLNSVSISSDGTVTGTYSNGRVASLAQVAIAQFQADDGLKRMDGGTYGETVDSGRPTMSLKGSTVAGGSIENSNVDIADEFSKLIVTQQAYSANTKVLTTSQQMLTDMINIIR